MLCRNPVCGLEYSIVRVERDDDNVPYWGIGRRNHSASTPGRECFNDCASVSGRRIASAARKVLARVLREIPGYPSCQLWFGL